MEQLTWDGATWIIEIVDSDGDVGEFLSLAFNSLDYPSIGYFDSSNALLKLARWNGSTWTLEIVDDGRGFDLVRARKGGGLGLRGIAERVQQIKGELDIITSPGQGTTVRVRAPLH